MQAKHLIIIALIGIVALFAFNMLTPSPQPVVSATTEAVDTTAVSEKDTSSSTNSEISEKPLAQQPKAMIDKAKAQADNVQQLEQDKAAQIDAQTAQ